jgi:uncharacterized membrane protein YcfT
MSSLLERVVPTIDPAPAPASPAATVGPPAQKTRLVWVDAARGLCVIAVVMLHFRIFVYDTLVPPTNGIAVWTQFTEFFGGFRLPLLFAISGLVVSDRVRHGWVDRRNAVRVASSYWLYFWWLCVFAVMSALVVASGVPFKITSPGDFFAQLLVPNTTLWFVFALALYVVVLTSLRRVRPAIVLGELAVVSILSGLTPAADDQALWLHVIYYAFFFAAGIYLRPLLVWFATGRLWWKAFAALVVFIGCEQVWELTTEGNIIESTARLFRDSAAVALSLAAIALATRIPVFARAASAIGRRTLPIYIMQLPAIWALFLLPPVAEALQVPVVRDVAPIIGTVLIVAACLAVHAVLVRTPLRALFRLPDPVRDRILKPDKAAKREVSKPGRAANRPVVRPERSRASAP